MTLEVKSVATLLGTPVSYAYAVKAGPWLFLTGHEAFDWRTGAIDEAVAGPPGLSAVRHPSPEPPRGRFHLQPDARRARGIRQRFRARGPARPVLPEPARGRRLSSRPARRLRGLHPAEHVGRHGPRFRRKLDDLDLADRGRAARPDTKSAKSTRPGSPRRRHRALSRPWSATSSSSSPGRWRTTPAPVSIRARPFRNMPPGPASRSAGRPSS